MIMVVCVCVGMQVAGDDAFLRAFAFEILRCCRVLFYEKEENHYWRGKVSEELVEEGVT